MDYLALLFTFALFLKPVMSQLSCGQNTVFDSATNQCLCPEEVPQDPNTIVLGGLMDLDTFTWAEDVFNVTVEMLNEGPSLPLGVKIEYELRNSACDESTALRQYWNLRNTIRPHGIVGTRCSGPSTQVARISNLEEIPQISPASNSAVLSNDEEFPFFSRLVAPNDESGEVGAIVALMREFGWDRVAVLETDTQFAKDTVNAFRREWVGEHDDLSGKWTGSVAYSETIGLDPRTNLLDQESLSQALSSFPQNNPETGSRVIFLVAHAEHAFGILEAASQINFQPDTVWVGPSSWIGRTSTTTDFSWLPDLPGYIGVGTFRNDDRNYQEYLERLQAWQTDQGKIVLQELPPFAAETVDSIVALARAIVATPNRRDSGRIVQELRSLTFDGVSGPVAFTDIGDRMNPEYSILNAQNGAVGNDIQWTNVGVSGARIGSSIARVEDLCFRGLGCKVTTVPEDTYPSQEDSNKLPVWVFAIIGVLVVLFLAMVLKYRRSRRSKTLIKAELEVFQKSIVGMRAAVCHYVPKAVETSICKPSDIEEGPRKPSPRSRNVHWCWKETDVCMAQHDASNIFGDPKECWIKYGTDASDQLEKAFHGSKLPVSLSSGSYMVDVKAMMQTKVSTGFTREVQRSEENVADSHGHPSEPVDIQNATIGSVVPADLVGEPLMVLVEGDVIQISTQRDDGWAFGTKLHHSDEDLALKFVKEMNSSGEDANDVLADTGWFELSSTRIPTSDDLAALQNSVGNVAEGSLDPPPFWDPVIDATVAQKHELKAGHPERDAVVTSFMRTLPGRAKVVKVERIQNLAMYQSYIVKRSTICYREIGHQQADDTVQRKAIERFERSWLWHGSNVEVVGKIINQGFNRSFCGKNATVYGKGVYFARDASYSSSKTYSVPDSKGNQYMLACRVCVGEYCPGKHDALTPDVRDAKNNCLFDSTVGLLRGDSMQDPSIYVTYHDAQAYPEYLVTFKTN